MLIQGEASRKQISVSDEPIVMQYYDQAQSAGQVYKLSQKAHL